MNLLKFNIFSKVIFGLILGLVTFSMRAQQAPSSVCTFPSAYDYDEEVTWFFDLSGNNLVTGGEDLYFYSWEPNPIPGGAVKMDYVKEKIWSITVVPTELFQVTKQLLEEEGNSNFWCYIRKEDMTNVTGTIPYNLKEQIRLGKECECTGVPIQSNTTSFINFGSANVDSSEFYWNNISQLNSQTKVLDTSGVYRFEAYVSGSLTANSNSGLNNPQPSKLQELAVSEATSSYMSTTSCDGFVHLTCLKPHHKYKVSIFGSKSKWDFYSSRYTVFGATEITGTLQTSGSGISDVGGLYGNDQTFYEVELFPDVNGEITIQVGTEVGEEAFVNMIKVEEMYREGLVSASSVAINTSNLSTSKPSYLTVDYLPVNSTLTSVKWSVLDESVAKINDNGLLIPISEGNTKVIAINTFDNTITDTLDVVFANLIEELFLIGNATEDTTSTQLGLKMRPIYTRDSLLSGKYEIYTSIDNGGTFKFKDSYGNTYGGVSGIITEGEGNGLSSTTGWKNIVVDLVNNTYEINNVYGWNVVSHMLPKAPGQESWWGGVEGLTTYEGNGVWSAEINFSQTTHASQSPRLYFSQVGTSKTLRYIDDSKNNLIFKHQIVSNCGGDKIKSSSLYHFNGVYKVILDLNNFTFDMERPACATVDDHKIVFMGSSVCKGYGADAAPEDSSQYLGYAYQYKTLLENRYAEGKGDSWSYRNVSIGGNNTTDWMNRADRHLWGECGKYVVIGLSMANEGLLSGGQATFDKFKANMLKMIDTVRAHGMEPIIMGNYANASYGSYEYELIKEMNLLIHQWDVPSGNLLGALEDRNGKFLVGYINDPWHPNTIGYSEFHYALVPSLFDALADNKPQPTKIEDAYLNLNKSIENYHLEFVPEYVVHPFTYSFDVKLTSNGVIASFDTETGENEFSVDGNGSLLYISSASEGISSVSTINDGQWHKVTLTHYHGYGQTVLYIDSLEQGSVNEQIVATKFKLSNEFGPSANYRNLYFYRSAMNENEVTAMAQGKLLKSSLEIYAPLDGLGITSNDELYNYAQCMNTIQRVNYVTENVFIEAEDYYLAMDGVTEICAEGGFNVTDYDAGEWIVYDITLPDSGSYRVDYRVASDTDSNRIRFEKSGGQVIYGWVDVPNTGDMQSYATVSHEVVLPAGQQYVAIWSPTGGFNINWLNITPVAEGSSAKFIGFEIKSDIVLYPNPVVEILNIDGIDSNEEYLIMGVSGMVLKQGIGNRVDVSQLSAGVYLLSIPNKNEVLRFVKN